MLVQGGVNAGNCGRRQVTKYVCKKDKANLQFTVKNEQLQRLGKAYVGKVCHPGTTYCMQQEFHRQGIFTIKAIPMGANLVLLESDEEGEVNALINDGKEWLLQWFEEVRSWSPRDIDNERLAWVRVYGIPVQAW